MSMFCFQCEQTAHSTGCTAHGVCGKDPETASLQDLLVYVTEGISQYAHAARALGVKDAEVDRFVMEALFTTVTNVNFDPATVAAMITKGVELRSRMRSAYEKAATDAGKTPESFEGSAVLEVAPDQDAMVRQGVSVTIEKRLENFGKDVAGLQELIMYGLKGMAAYADHASILGVEDDAVYAFTHETLDFLARNVTDVDALVGQALKVGEVNLRVMEMLDAANTGSRYPRPGGRTGTSAALR